MAAVVPAELQLCWLVYIMGSIVGQHSTGGSSETDKNDGDLTAAVFQLSKVLSSPPPIFRGFFVCK